MKKFSGIIAIGLMFIGILNVYANEHMLRPKRIISLDYCSDQYVLMLADHDQIAALSPQAVSAVSFYKDSAKNIPLIKAEAELILSLQPDLVISSFPRHKRIMDLIARANIPTASLPYAVDENAQEKAIHLLAKLFGQPNKATAIIKTRNLIQSDNNQLRLSLAKNQKSEAALVTLYLSPGGYTSGHSTDIHRLMHDTGMTNIYQDRRGWFPLPLEQLITQPPHFILSSFYDDPEMATSPWGLADHYVVNSIIHQANRIDIPSKYMACNGLFRPQAIRYILENLAKDNSDDP